METVNGVTIFYTHDPKYGLMITKTSNPAVIEKLSGLTSKKEKHWKREYQEGDEPGKPTGPKLYLFTFNKFFWGVKMITT